jgi:hypothetical protein
MTDCIYMHASTYVGFSRASIDAYTLPLGEAWGEAIMDRAGRGFFFSVYLYV